MQVLYIDTERKFSAGRLVEIAAACAADPNSNPGGSVPHPGNPAALATRVLVASPASALELLSMLQVRRPACVGAAGADSSMGLPQPLRLCSGLLYTLAMRGDRSSSDAASCVARAWRKR